MAAPSAVAATSRNCGGTTTHAALQSAPLYSGRRKLGRPSRLRPRATAPFGCVCDAGWHLQQKWSQLRPKNTHRMPEDSVSPVQDHGSVVHELTSTKLAGIPNHVDPQRTSEPQCRPLMGPESWMQWCHTVVLCRDHWLCQAHTYAPACEAGTNRATKAVEGRSARAPQTTKLHDWAPFCDTSCQ